MNIDPPLKEAFKSRHSLQQRVFWLTGGLFAILPTCNTVQATQAGEVTGAAWWDGVIALEPHQTGCYMLKSIYYQPKIGWI